MQADIFSSFHFEIVSVLLSCACINVEEIRYEWLKFKNYDRRSNIGVFNSVVT